MRTLVLSIDGGCRSNSRTDSNSIAAFAVHFGRSSPDNSAALLDPQEPQTSNRAELHAAIAALQIITGLWPVLPSIPHLLPCPSPYRDRANDEL
jgi:ribonuclease HI